MRNKCVANHVMKRDNQFYYVRHIPSDLTHHYSVQRICFSLKTKSDSTAVRFSKSITQRLDDYWFGMRLKNMNVPAGDKIKLDGAINDDNTPKISEALDLYLIKYLYQEVKKGQTLFLIPCKFVSFLNQDIVSITSIHFGLQ